MANVSDPHDPSHFLRRGETILWQGRPDPYGKGSRAVAYIRLWGYLMLGCFIFFLVISWANREELEGAIGILVTFLIISGGTSVAFLFVLPALSRRIIKSTRYAVAGHFAIIIRGVFGTEILRYPIPKTLKIQTNIDKEGRHSIIFAYSQGRVNMATSRSAMALGFERLTPEAGDAARAALEQIKGQGGEDAKFERQRL